MASQQNIYSQLEHLQSKYVGTGHPDITRHEWIVNQHRDSLASYLGHAHLVQYFAVAEGLSAGRVRHNLLEKMYRPCGDAPPLRKRTLADLETEATRAAGLPQGEEDGPGGGAAEKN